MKFGGSSVSTAENWQTIANLLKHRLEQGLQPLVVHSALQGVSECAGGGTERRLLMAIRRMFLRKYAHSTTHWPRHWDSMVRQCSTTRCMSWINWSPACAWFGKSACASESGSWPWANSWQRAWARPIWNPVACRSVGRCPGFADEQVAKYRPDSERLLVGNLRFRTGLSDCRQRCRRMARSS